MSEENDTARRGPGRTRKNEASSVTTDLRPKHEAPEPEPADPRIGQKCDPAWSGIGYDDGSFYRCANGKIVERVF